MPPVHTLHTREDTVVVVDLMVLRSLVGLMLQRLKEAWVRSNQVSNRTAYTLSKKCFNLDMFSISLYVVLITMIGK